MANAFVRSTTGSGTGASLGVTITQPASGNVLVVFAECIAGTSRSVSSISCTNTTGWFKLNGIGTTNRIEIWAGSVGASAGTTVTVNYSGTTTSNAAQVAEFSGVTMTSDGITATGSTGSSVTPSTGTFTVNTAGSLLLVGAMWAAQTTASASPATSQGYSNVNNSTGSNNDYKLSATAGANSAATWTITSAAWSTTVAALKTSAPSVAYVQSKSSTSSSTVVSSQATTFTSANTAGNLLIAYAACLGGTTLTDITVADSLGNTWIPATNFFHDGNSGFSMRMYYVSSCLAGSNTVTGTLVNNTSDFTVVAVYEVSGLGGGSVDQIEQDAGTSATTVSIGPTPTTSAAAEFIFAAWMAGTSTTAAGSGYTLKENTTMSGGGTEYQVVSATGAYTATATTSGAWAGQIATFRTNPAVALHFLALLGCGA